MDIAFDGAQMRPTRHVAHNLAPLKQLTLNLILMDPVQRKGGIRAKRIIAAISGNYRAYLLGLDNRKAPSSPLDFRLRFMRSPCRAGLA